jgi:hypothetical protein
MKELFLMRRLFAATILLATGCLMTSPGFAATDDSATTAPWPVDKANAWYAQKPWLVGANYGPATAINQLEMWQADTFDPERIDLELGWAQSLGFTSMRVYLHHMLWEQDSKGLLERMEKYLEISHKHGIGTMFVLFDSVWDPFPKPGKQREPRPSVHNSGWVQSPGADVLKDPSKYPMLEAYVKGVVGHFKDDKRIDVWDVWNEPDNPVPQYKDVELKNKKELVKPLLEKSFLWARQAGATQPLTSGVWVGTFDDPSKLKPIEKVQIEYSDIISFHNYDKPESLEKTIKNLQRYQRPLLCTEYMARPNGSTFDPNLGILKKHNVGAYNWGFVQGKTNTIFPWDSWEKKYGAEPPVWFHDIFRTDGTPYRQAEVDYIRSLTGADKNTSGTTAKSDAKTTK